MKALNWVPIALSCAGGSLLAFDPTEEPPLRFELRLGDETVEVRAGTPFEVSVDGKAIKGELVARPTRRLVLEEHEFEYPQGMTFEYESVFGTKIWTLDGNDSVVMVYRHLGALSLDEFAELIADGLSGSFGAPEESAVSIHLGGREVHGRALVCDGSGFFIHSELFQLGAGARTRSTLILQDVRHERDEPTEEFLAVRQLLEETFTGRGNR